MATYLGKTRVGLTLGYGQGVTDCKVEDETMTIPVNVQCVKEAIKRDGNLLPFDIKIDNGIPVSPSNPNALPMFNDGNEAQLFFRTSIEFPNEAFKNELTRGDYYIFPYVKKRGKWKPLLSVPEFLSRVNDAEFSDSFGKLRITDVYQPLSIPTAKLLGALIGDDEGTLTDTDYSNISYIFCSNTATTAWLKNEDYDNLTGDNSTTMTVDAEDSLSITKIYDYKVLHKKRFFLNSSFVREWEDSIISDGSNSIPCNLNYMSTGIKPEDSIVYVGLSSKAYEYMHEAPSVEGSVTADKRCILKNRSAYGKFHQKPRFVLRFAIRKITEDSEKETGYSTIRTPLSKTAIMGRFYGGYQTSPTASKEDGTKTYLVYAYLRKWEK